MEIVIVGAISYRGFKEDTISLNKGMKFIFLKTLKKRLQNAVQALWLNVEFFFNSLIKK